MGKPRQQQVGRANLDGTNVTQTFVTTGSTPESVKVTATNIYWANYGGAKSIGRSDLNGGNVIANFITTASNPTGIAVNGSRLYWSNIDLGTIGRANLDGSDVNQSFITGTTRPESLVANNQYIYWSASTAGAVGRASIDGTGMTNAFVTGMVSTFGVGLAAAKATDDLPVISAISPAGGTPAGWQALTIAGGLLTGASVTIQGKPCTSIVVNEAGTSLTCRTPAGKAGPADVVVTTTFGAATSAGGFTFTGSTTSKAVTITDVVVTGSRTQKVAKLSGNTRMRSTRVWVYRAKRNGGIATLVRVTRSSDNSWTAKKLSLGGRRVAYFCAIAQGGSSASVRAPKVAGRSVADARASAPVSHGDIVRCPRV